MVNRKNLDALIEFIEKEEVISFDMQRWIYTAPRQDPYVDEQVSNALAAETMAEYDALSNRFDNLPVAPCNTAACIGGTCELLLFIEANQRVPANNREFREYSNVFDTNEAVSEFLGIDNMEAEALCFPDHIPGPLKQEALAVLRHLGETGEVDWERFVKEGDGSW